MKKGRRVKVYAMVNGVTVGIANFHANSEQTIVDAQLPEDKRLRVEVGALWLMAASNAIEIPWIKAKLLTVIAGLNQMLSRGITDETPPDNIEVDDWLWDNPN